MSLVGLRRRDQVVVGVGGRAVRQGASGSPRAPSAGRVVRRARSGTGTRTGSGARPSSRARPGPGSCSAPGPARAVVAGARPGVAAEERVERLVQRVLERDLVAERHQHLAQQRVAGVAPVDCT